MICSSEANRKGMSNTPVAKADHGSYGYRKGAIQESGMKRLSERRSLSYELYEIFHVSTACSDSHA